MPSDAVTIVVSAGIGISVIAGVLSGMCYILVHGLKRKRSEEQTSKWQCSVCGTYLRPRFPDESRAVLCMQCEERVCKSRCSKRAYTRKGWICYNCLKYSSCNDMKMLEPKKRKFDSVNTMKINPTLLQNTQEKNHIRDFIENLVSVILGETVDDASVLRIHTHRQYNKLFEKYHQNLCNAISNLSAALHVVAMDDVPYVVQSPSTAHSNLKKILENVIKDASRMSSVSDDLEYSICDHKEQTYEELLAAAILNKVISKYQNTLSTMSEGNSSIRSSDPVRQEELEWHSDDFESNSSSASDENVASDSCYSSAKYVDEISLTIQKQVEELYSKISEGNADSCVDDKYFVDDGSNWYMQKRLFLTSHSPIPVPMVVPNPLSNSKVLIGEKEIDDTSDLSDEESKLILKPIGDSGDDKMSADSGIKEERDDKSQFYFHQKSDNDADTNMDESLKSLYEDVDDNLQYLGKYPRLTQTVLKNVTSIQKYGRDYYKRQASLPSGRKKTFEEYEDGSSSEDSSFNPPNYFEETHDATNSNSDNYKFEYDGSIPYEYSQSRIDVNTPTSINTDDSENDENSKTYIFIPFADRKLSRENLTIKVNTENLVHIPEITITPTSPDDDKNLSLSDEQTKVTPTTAAQDEDVFSPSDQLPQSEIVEYKKNDYDVASKHDTIYEAKKIFISADDQEVKPKIRLNKIKEKKSLDEANGSTTPSSTDDLSFGDNDVKGPLAFVGRKCDNTLIRKIYSNPVVRSFTLENRKHIPIETEDNIGKKQVDQQKDFVPVLDPQKRDAFILHSTSLEEQTENNNNNQTLNLNNLTPNDMFSLEYSDNETYQRPQVRREYDYSELKEKKLVASRLNAFSKSFPNLVKASQDVPQQEDIGKNKSTNNLEWPDGNFVSVKNLKKMFENNEASSKKDQPVHSLTARSIPKQMKENLKNFGSD